MTRRLGRTIRAVDLFCGAGGTSTGLVQAADRLGANVDLLAVNHWATAVETHAANHPESRHACASLDSIDPRKEIKGKLDLLVASPECTHHSSARGGKPCSDQSRASAWHVVAWADQLRPRSILVENVQEFRTWGPLDERGRPYKRRVGETYEAWLAALRSLGYRVDARVLNAADYGDATTRRRLFVVATLDTAGPVFPNATHERDGLSDLFGSRERWRPAREIIDWTFPSRSIFDRSKPLADATLRRIEEGLRRFGGEAAEPFLALLRGTSTVRSLDIPIPALTAGGTHVGLVEPFTLSQQSGGSPRLVSQPIQALATKGAVSLVEPFVVPTNFGEREGQRPRTHSLRAPYPTITGTVSHGLVEPHVIQLTHGGRLHDVNAPLPTITTAHRGEFGVVEPFVVPYYGTGTPSPVRDPVPTITTRDRFGLCEPGGRAVDIRFRMLQPHELAAAMSFPDDYKFSGNRGEVVKQIGNAVPVRVASALCGALLDRMLRAG